MKVEFRKAQRAMRKTGEITISEGLNHAELVNLVSEGVFQAMGESEKSPEPTIELEEHANAVKQINNQASEMAEMREMIKSMQQMILQCTNVNQNNRAPAQNQPFNLQNGYVQVPLGDITALLQNNNTNNNNQYNRRRGGRGGRGGRGNVSRTGKYCWTHGGCNHYGPDCESKAEGHKDEATFQNKMGGSTKNCSN